MTAAREEGRQQQEKSTHGIEASPDHEDKEKREELDPRMAGWYRKGSVPGREQRQETREKRDDMREIRTTKPDTKFEGTSAKWDLRNEQQREKKEESREKREKREESREG